MRTALIAAICFFCGAALLAPTKQIFNIGPFRGGEYSLHGNQLWSVGPLAAGEVFVVPSTDNKGRSIVLKGINSSLQYKVGAAWVPVLYYESYSYNAAFRPGIRLPAGEYRFSEAA